MTSHDDLGEFLASRRARLTPAQAGLPDFGGRRRVPGLRREEVAMVAGVSPEYYKRLERGQAAGVSESVLDAVSRALQLDDAEHAHLHALVRTATTGNRPARRRTTRARQVSPGMQQVLDAMTTVPVFVQNGRLDAVATNRLGRALFSEMFPDDGTPVNAARFVFLDPRAQTFYRDWDVSTREIVALLRAEAGRAPHDRELSDLVGLLSTRSDLFRTLWGSHDVREHRSGRKRLRHPLVGDLDLGFQGLEVTTDRGLEVLVFTAEPGTPSDEGLRLLASWTGSSSAIERSSATADGTAT